VHNDKYILVDDEPVAVDLMTWARWYEKADRTIAKAYIGKVLVSTVFLGLDHSFGSDGPPILYETMIFRGRHDGYQERYSTLAEAKAGHAKAVKVATPWWRSLLAQIWKGVIRG
jgi:hypothetical protein